MTLTELLASLGFALLLTVLTEGAVAFLMTRKARYVLYNYWCNLLTNPLLNLMLFAVRGMHPPGAVIWLCILCGEAAVFFGEAYLCKRMDGGKQARRWYLRFSLLTNAASFLLGLIFIYTAL